MRSPADEVEAAGCAGQQGVWNTCPIVGLLGLHVDAVLAVGVCYTMVGCWARKSACTTCRSAGVRAGRLCGWQRGTACGGCGLLPVGLAALRRSSLCPLSFRMPFLGSSLSARLPSRCRHEKSGKRSVRFPLWCGVLRSRLRSVLDYHVDDLARYDDRLLDGFAGRVLLQLRIGQHGGLDLAHRCA